MKKCAFEVDFSTPNNSRTFFLPKSACATSDGVPAPEQPVAIKNGLSSRTTATAERRMASMMKSRSENFACTMSRWLASCRARLAAATDAPDGRFKSGITRSGRCGAWSL